MKPITTLNAEASFANPGSFLLGETRFVAGKKSAYRNLTYRPMERIQARNALGMPTPDYLVLIDDDFTQADYALKVLPVLLESVKPNSKGRLIFTGGSMDMPDTDLCAEMRRVERFLQSDGNGWKWTFVGRKSEQVMRYYYSAANLVVLSLSEQTEKLCNLIQSLFTPAEVSYA